jgi:chitinase
VTRLLLALMVTLAVGGGVAASGADFTASSSSPGSTFATAADFNTVAVSVTAPAGTLTGSPTIGATATSDRGIASVTLQYAPAGTSDWSDICAAASCPWNTTAVADGAYDLRAIATDNAGYSRMSAKITRTLDNFTLAVTLADPGANVSGTKQLTATATGAASGIASLKLQHRAAGMASWIDVCPAVTTTSITCGLNTVALPDGARELRAIVTDGSGASAISALRTTNVDNAAPTATPHTPSTGSGTVTMTVDAQDTGSGVQFVAWEAKYQGVWYEFCRDTSAPYACSGDSTMVADGTYPLRVHVRDNANVDLYTSETPITIDNPPAPTDVQAGNGGATAGLMQAGDWIRVTWNETILPGSVLAGWTGSSQAIRVRVIDNGTNDRMEFLDAAGTTRVNLTAATADLPLGANFVSGATAELNATMAQSGASITVTLGAAIGTPTLLTAGAGTMSWKPSAAATDATGHASKTTTVNESGGLDVDF